MSLCDQTQRYLDGVLGPQERAESERHVRECPRCKPMVEAWEGFAARYREEARALNVAPTAQQTDALLRKAREAARPTPRPAWQGFALAAAVLLVAVGLGAWWRSSPEPLPTFALGAAGARIAVAQDSVDATSAPALLSVGSDQVGLSTGSRLTLERRDTRQVRLRLEAGTVAAAVTKRARGETFVVLSGGYEVTVVGTRFRVSTRAGGVRVEVSEGRVRVKPPQGDPLEVLGGEALEWSGGQASRGTFAAPDFEELSVPDEARAPEPPEAGSVAEVPDAGGDDVVDAGSDDAERPDNLKRPVGQAQLERWRRDALGGKCAALLAPLRAQARAHPRQADVWRLLADCLRLESNDAEAAATYRRVAAISAPDEADRARVLLAGLLQDKLGDAPGAERVLREYLQRSHAPALEAAARVKLARALLAQKKTKQAKVELQRVVQQLPESPPALEALGLLEKL